MALVEGVMGLFDGIGSSEKTRPLWPACWICPSYLSLMEEDKASLGALVRDSGIDPTLNLAGVVLNKGTQNATAICSRSSNESVSPC